MKTNRRNFISKAAMGGLAASAFPLTGCSSKEAPADPTLPLRERYAKLDQILTLPVLKKELFPDPVIIESVEYLRDRNAFLCRVRTKDGATFDKGSSYG